MLYEMSIRGADGKLQRLLYNTVTERLWYAETGLPYVFAIETKRPITVKVPVQITEFALHRERK